MSDPQIFTAFGTTHLLTIATIALVSVGLPWWLRRLGSDRLTRRIAIGLAVFGIVHELVKTLAWVVVWDQPPAASLPLEICGVAVFLAATVLIWRTYRVYEVLYFWGLAGALQAILTPEMPYDFPHPVFLTFFISHGLILLGLFYATVAFGLRPTWSSVPRVFAITLIYAFGVVAPLNLLLDTNYMFLRTKPPTESVLDHFGPWPWYIAATAAFTFASFVIYYLPFWIRDVLARRGASAASAPADAAGDSQGQHR